MNASERLQAIIKERREWESFGWGPLLTAWAVVLVAKAAVELWTGPRPDVGFGAYLAALAAQSILSAFPSARSGARQVQMHGLWALIAVSAWFFGSWSPTTNLLSVQAASVIEMLFLAAGLVLTGILKGRKVLFFGGVGLGAAALLVAVFPILWAWRPLLLVITFGVAAVVTLIADHRSDIQK